MNDTPPKGMVIDWDVPIPMDDGIVVRADIFRPAKPGRYPVLLSYGPYGKGLSYQEAYAPFWQVMVDEFPEVLQGSSNRYQAWETVDPEKWVPDGYVCIRVDSRGAGTSPGVLDLYSSREAQDLYHCIEWAGTQEWSSGKVGLTGISYYAINQWQVAGLQPPHLAAMCVWEGASDFYRDCYRHGGILSDIATSPWYTGQILGVQHGKGENGKRSAVTGALVSGPETFDEETLRANRVELPDQLLEHRFDDEYYRSRLPNFDKIDVPLLSAANWGGAGIHLRGNIEGYLAAATKNKWLEVHGNNHVAPFYLDSSIAFQKRFFGQFLKGEDTGWDQQPPVELKIRHPGERFVSRAEQEWPLARTDWQRHYLRPDLTLGREAQAGAPLSYETMGEGLTFLMPALEEDVEITGPLALKLFVSSQTTDADIFAVFRLFDSAGVETLFIGANDSAQPLTLGWLRASHRKLDPVRSLPYRPYHAHPEAEPLTPGEIAELDVEIWPTSIVVPKGHRLGLTIRGKDYENAPHYLPQSSATMRGVSLLSHTSTKDRPPEVFDTVNTLHFDAERAPYLLLPVIPSDPGDAPIDWFAHLRGKPMREG
jgi:predicted acyl esterase